MTPETFLDGKVTLHCGDSLDVLDSLADNSIDGSVNDPPYHFASIVKRFGAADAAPAQHGTVGAFARASRGFMGKTWDGGNVAFRPETWAKVLRVLKPGAHLVAFAAPKNVGHLQVAIEAAGFETRDCILDLIDLDPLLSQFVGSLNDAQRCALFRLMDEGSAGGLLAWLFGSGFPKSHNIAKAIDKRRDEDADAVRVVCRAIRAAMDARHFKSRDLVAHFDGCHPRLIDHWAARDTDSQPSLPTMPQWRVLKTILPLGDDLDVEVARLNVRKGEPSDDWKAADVIGTYEGEPGGFGDHRFTTRDKVKRALSAEAQVWAGFGTALKPAFEPIILARKPLDGTVAENVLKWGTGALNIDACRVPTGDTIRATRNVALGSSSGGIYGSANASGVYVQKDEGRWPADVMHDGSPAVVAAFPQEDGGSAARFFYNAKADDDDRLGSKHPTVKPLDLMQYLVRLITRPGQTVLDLFAGTGTTGEAAFREGRRAVLIEREAEYQDDIRRRMRLALGGREERVRESLKAAGEVDAPESLPLFGGLDAATPPAPVERSMACSPTKKHRGKSSA